MNKFFNYVKNNSIFDIIKKDGRFLLILPIIAFISAIYYFSNFVNIEIYQRFKSLFSNKLKKDSELKEESKNLSESDKKNPNLEDQSVVIKIYPDIPEGLLNSLKDEANLLKNQGLALQKRLMELKLRLNLKELQEKCYPWQNMRDNYKGLSTNFVKNAEDFLGLKNNMDKDLQHIIAGNPENTSDISEIVHIFAEKLENANNLLKTMEEKVVNSEINLPILREKIISDINLREIAYPKGEESPEPQIVELKKILETLKKSVSDSNFKSDKVYIEEVKMLEKTAETLEQKMISLKQKPEREEIEKNNKKLKEKMFQLKDIDRRRNKDSLKEKMEEFGRILKDDISPSEIPRPNKNPDLGKNTSPSLVDK